MSDLFAEERIGQREAMGRSAFVLRGYALPHVAELLTAVKWVRLQAPFRRMTTPGGRIMSIAVTNCGRLGWTTSPAGYRYAETDPLSGRPWPEMPRIFRQMATAAAAEMGFSNYEPDACAINLYEPESRLTLHQDKNERDYNSPIIAISLGMTATFLFGGHERFDRAEKYPVFHGDVTGWGGEDRLRYHGIQPLKEEPHPILGAYRLSLTFRRAG